MEYILKKEYSESVIVIPFDMTSKVGKFIDPALYPFMYRKYPDLFEEPKTTQQDAISIADSKQADDRDSKGEV